MEAIPAVRSARNEREKFDILGKETYKRTESHRKMAKESNVKLLQLKTQHAMDTIL